jgi:hypothetical protein
MTNTTYKFEKSNVEKLVEYKGYLIDAYDIGYAEIKEVISTDGIIPFSIKIVDHIIGVKVSSQDEMLGYTKAYIDFKLGENKKETLPLSFLLDISRQNMKYARSLGDNMYVTDRPAEILIPYILEQQKTSV